MLVLPAIHRFNFSHSPRESTWGWHKTDELIECINNALKESESSKSKTITKKDLFRVYGHLNRTDSARGYGLVKTFPFIEKEELICSNFGTKDPGDLTADFVPAKWGLEIINSIRHPVRHALSNGALKVVEFISIDGDPLTRPRLM